MILQIIEISKPDPTAFPLTNNSGLRPRRSIQFYASDDLKRKRRPGVEPPQLELVINLKTAEKIGVTIPPEILLEANEVIK